MEIKHKRYEFLEEDITLEGAQGIIFDICPQEGDIEGKLPPHLQVLAGDKDDFHKILGGLQFKNTNNLKLVQHGLELIETALMNESEETNEMIVELDGNSVCIKREDFVNLQESPSLFIELTPEQISKFEELEQ